MSGGTGAMTAEAENFIDFGNDCGDGSHEKASSQQWVSTSVPKMLQAAGQTRPFHLTMVIYISDDLACH